jgi:hypothetical protein
MYLYVWYGFWWANARERHHSADLSVYGRMILKWNLNKTGTEWTGFIWLGIGASVRLL